VITIRAGNFLRDVASFPNKKEEEDSQRKEEERKHNGPTILGH